MPNFSTPHDTAVTGTATTLMLTLDTAGTQTFTITNIQISNTRPGQRRSVGYCSPWSVCWRVSDANGHAAFGA